MTLELRPTNAHVTVHAEEEVSAVGGVVEVSAPVVDLLRAHAGNLAQPCVDDLNLPEAEGAGPEFVLSDHADVDFDSPQTGPAHQRRCRATDPAVWPRVAERAQDPAAQLRVASREHHGVPIAVVRHDHAVGRAHTRGLTQQRHGVCDPLEGLRFDDEVEEAVGDWEPLSIADDLGIWMIEAPTKLPGIDPHEPLAHNIPGHAEQPPLARADIEQARGRRIGPREKPLVVGAKAGRQRRGLIMNLDQCFQNAVRSAAWSASR